MVRSQRLRLTFSRTTSHTTIPFSRPDSPNFNMSYPMYPPGPQSGFVDPAGYPINPSVPSPQPFVLIIVCVGC